MNRKRLIAQLKNDEGETPHVYKDSEGYYTVGVGRLLDERRGGRLSHDEIDYLLNNDIDRTYYRLNHDFVWFNDLNDVRQEVLINMAFNLGMNGLKGFRRMIAAIQRDDWVDASREGLDSRWAEQVGDRAVRLMRALLTGEVIRIV